MKKLIKQIPVQNWVLMALTVGMVVYVVYNTIKTGKKIAELDKAVQEGKNQLPA